MTVKQADALFTPPGEYCPPLIDGHDTARVIRHASRTGRIHWTYVLGERCKWRAAA